MGHLDVVVPPDFVSEDTSGDVMVPEGGTVKLTCRARGYPAPHVLWRREDGVDIVIKEPTGVKTKGECPLCPQSRDPHWDHSSFLTKKTKKTCNSFFNAKNKNKSRQ